MQQIFEYFGCLMILHVVSFFFFFNPFCVYALRDVNIDRTKTLVQIGVVLDHNSTMGSMADLCMRMALDDFYSAHSNYTTRLQLNIKNANSLLDANFAAIDLVKRKEVQGIVGPQGSMEDTFVSELGEKVHIPIISFTAKSSSLYYPENQYYVRTTPDDLAQARALAAICQGYGWPGVVLLYEESDYGNQFLSNLNKALREVEVGLAYMVPIPTSASDGYILKELKNLATKQTRVFIIHMSPSLGYRLFALTKSAGVMSEGYAWIITDSLSNVMNSLDREAMHGVLGVRPYIPQLDDLKSFRERWKREMVLKNDTGRTTELNVYGLWAYDSVIALAMAVEKVGYVNNSVYDMNRTKDGTNLRISTFGPNLVKELSRTKFRGLSGEFELVDGKLKSSKHEIFNMIGNGENTIGYWTQERGIVRELSSIDNGNYSTSTKELKKVIWPGDSFIQPKGWAIPATGNLRVGIPWKHGFTEFVKVETDPVTNHVYNATGFSIDIFLAALNQLPFPINHEFHPYNDTANIDWSYDDMLDEIPQKFDIVVGDTTIWAPRADVVDFSLPYSESGVILVVKNKKSLDIWIFIRPLSWDLWLAIVVACFLMGIILRILERRVTSNSQDSLRINEDRTHGMIYWSPVTVLAFPERNMVSNNWSIVVLVFWLFMAFILMQSYTANLSAILTIDQLKFAFSDSYYLGYQEGSFMKEFLIEQLHISESRLKSYSSAEQYHEAMAKGSKNGGIDAIFDEVPYMKIFLNKYDSQYKMVGPTYRTGGFGFAFPRGSPLVANFSKAILDVVQGPNMTAIEQKNFGPGYSSQDPLSSTISQETASLTLHDFAGLFLIIGSVIIFALFCSETPIGRKLTEKIGHFIHTCRRYRNSYLHSSENSSFNGDPIHNDEGEEIQEPMENNSSEQNNGDGEEDIAVETLGSTDEGGIPLQDLGVGPTHGHGGRDF